MFAKHVAFNISYFIILLVNICALLFNNEILKLVALPLIATSLILYLIIKTRLESSFHQLIFIGLIFSLAGDTQYLFSKGSDFHLFTTIIASFLCYSIYSYAYFLDYKQDYSKSRRVGNVFFVLLCVVGSSFFIASNNNLYAFKYLIIGYIFITILMNVLAGYRYLRVNQLSFKLILTGSFAFVISDLAVGFYNFIEQKNDMLIVYLTTYLLAQYLIVMGTIERRPVILD